MPRITLVLHNIRSTHNVGSIFRTAEGFGVEKIIISGYTPYPRQQNDTRLPHISEKITKQIHKTALDAETMVKFDVISDINVWLNNYDNPILALEQSPESTMLDQYAAPSELALILGEEVEGVDETLLQKTDSILEIPMVGKKESFNVSIAAGIALYHLTR